MSQEEARDLRVWLTDYFSDRLAKIEQLSIQRSDEMKLHTEAINQLQATDIEILDRLDRIEGYFATLVNIRTFIVWATPLLTAIAAVLAIIWSLN